jgi:hypothetical protein
MIDEKWEARDADKRCAMGHSCRPDRDHTVRLHSDAN